MALVLAGAAGGLLAGGLAAQDREYGPYVESAGPVFPVPDPDFETPLDMTYRVAFEIYQGPSAPDAVNTQLETAARFLNMHGRAGVPLANLDVALVVHGPAGRALLQSAAYETREGVPNPNVRLIEELHEAGVKIILCGQTAAARDLPRAELLPQVEVALSAMTALAVLQEEGYRVNPF